VGTSKQQVNVKADWLSFTTEYTLGAPQGDYTRHSPEYTASWVAGLVRETVSDSFFAGEISLDAGRSPYQYRITDEKGITVFFNWLGTAPALVEITGRGCDLLIDEGVMNTVIDRWLDRISRFDVAVDILTDIDPREFAKEFNNPRITTTAEFVSESGTTCYIGSRKGDRYCRVYRYNEPNPRHDLLRIEFVAKRQTAKVYAEQWLANDPIVFAAAAGAVYEFQHPVWVFDEVEALPKGRLQEIARTLGNG